MKADDFWTTHQTAAATRGVGPAHTDWDFAKAVETSVVPVISHETGQRPVFPDYPSLLPKFSGPLLPLNLRRYQRAFLESGMADQAGSFVRASALFQLVQYKAEHEAMLRTLGLGGYQLLMLNDFTGQSEALVGVLDPFWDSKGIVSVKDVRRWNNPTVPLARFSKYGWNQDELFRAKLELAHFGNQDLRDQSLVWHLRTGDDQVISEGKFAASHVRRGTLSTLGEISVPLTNLSGPAFLTLDAQIGGAENAWRIWVYPAREKTPVPEQLLVVHSWSDSVSQALAEGKRVLFLAHGLTNSHAARTGFESVYWSAGWWGNRFSMLGIVCDPSHPALAAFPNQGHSDWNWRDLCSGATTLQLPNAPAGLRPVIQGVPDFHYNSLLSHLFEVRVGNGALAVCGYDLESKLETRPAARQFRESLISYLTSPKFKPQTEATESWVAELLSTRQQ
jgi:hypothetical protein